MEHLLPESLRDVGIQALTELGDVVPRVVEPNMVLASEHPPVLHSYDRRGHRIDEIEFHPSYYTIESLILNFGVIRSSYTSGWRGAPGRLPRVLTTAFAYMFLESDQSIMGCPIFMTDAMALCLERNDSELAARFVPGLASDTGEFLRGAMLLTERFGGSDVGANEVTARHLGDRMWQLNGEKWFASCPHSDLFLVTARPEGAAKGSKGLGLFLVPRMLDDGSRNTINIRRLKEKFGTRAMASGEIEFENAFAYQVGALEKGIVQMLDMVNLTRVYIAFAGAATMRRNVFEAVHHSTSRVTFGRRLLDHPLMADTLLEMTVDAVAGTAAAFAVVRVLDKSDSGDSEAALVLRLLTPLFKAYNTERARLVAAEAMEVRGGNGVINDWPDARILRDISVHAIWEGSSNVIALDVLRAIQHNAFPSFARDIRSRLDTVPTSAPVFALVETLSEVLGAQECDLVELGKLSDARQRLSLRRRTRTLAILATASHLVEQSVWEWNELRTSRLAYLAARYVARLGGDRGIERLADDGEWLPHAEALLNGGPVPDDLARKACNTVAVTISRLMDFAQERFSTHS